MSGALALNLVDDVFRGAGNLIKGKGALASFNAGRQGANLGAKLMNQADDLRNLTTLYKNAPDIGVSIPQVSDDFLDIVKAEKLTRQQQLVNEVLSRGDGNTTAARLGKLIGQAQNATGLKMHDSFGSFMHTPVGMIMPEMVVWTGMDALSRALMDDVVPVNSVQQIQPQQYY